MNREFNEEEHRMVNKQMKGVNLSSKPGGNKVKRRHYFIQSTENMLNTQ